MKKILSTIFATAVLSTFAGTPATTDALTSFDAIYNNKSVSFKWTINNPVNLNGVFTIERSKDGKAWEKVSEIKSTLNGQGSIEFMDTDSKPLKKKSFYRLKYTEADGTQDLSRLVSVEKAHGKPKLLVSVSEDSEGIVFSKFKKDEQVVLVVRDKSGNEFYSKSIMLSGKNQLILDKEMNLPVGDYTIVASSHSGLYTSNFSIH